MILILTRTNYLTLPWINSIVVSIVKRESLVASKEDDDPRFNFSSPSPSPLTVLPYTPPPTHFYKHLTSRRSTSKVDFLHQLQLLQKSHKVQAYGMSLLLNYISYWLHTIRVTESKETKSEVKLENYIDHIYYNILVEGIPRSAEVQQKEAIGILSVAVENLIKRLRRQIGMYAGPPKDI